MNVIQEEGTDKVKSREVLKTKRFEATLIIMQQGQQIPPHTSPVDAMVLVLEGKIAFMLNEEVTVLETGDVLTFQAKEIHALQALETARFLLVK
ncbi:cupin domain-containing protein [Chitinophaga flava]|nr:cupin domain-containing protein [Chitinophaga flava]